MQPLKHIDKNLHNNTLQKHRTTLILLRFKMHRWKCTHNVHKLCTACSWLKKTYPVFHFFSYRSL